MYIIPRADELRREIERLTNQLALLFDERDHLKSILLPNIEREYQLALGGLEYEKFSLSVELQQAKRTIELIQSYLNRKEIPDRSKIEEKIREEFSAWKKKLDECAKEIENAKKEAENLSVISPEERAEIRTLYRNIAKRLHPDVAGELTKEKATLWQQAQDAYKRFDLDELRSIALLLEAETPTDTSEYSLHQLEEKIEGLKKAIENLTIEIAEIRGAPPYTHRSLLLNSEALSERQATLRDEIANLRVQLQFTTILLTELRKDWNI